MTAIFTISFHIDGTPPSREVLEEAVRTLLNPSGYIGSEGIDGSGDWGLEVQEVSMEIKE